MCEVLVRNRGLIEKKKKLDYCHTFTTYRESQTTFIIHMAEAQEGSKGVWMKARTQATKRVARKG